MPFDTSFKPKKHNAGKSDFHTLIHYMPVSPSYGFYMRATLTFNELITSHVFHVTTTFVIVHKAYCFNDLHFRITVTQTLFLQFFQKIRLSPKGLFKHLHCFNSPFNYRVPYRKKLLR